MRALTIADSANIILGLQDEIRRSEESRYDHRLHGVLLVAQGLTCPEVAKLLGDAPRSVEYWIGSFEKRGLAGLREGERSGRPGAWMRRNCEESMLLFERRPAIWDWLEPYGMAKLSRPGLRRSMRLTWEYVSASVFFGSWAFGCASRGPVLPKPIRNGKRCIKKTPSADGGRDRRSLGHGRSTFPAAWFPLPDVDSTGDQGSSFAARSHAKECGILRRGAVAG